MRSRSLVVGLAILFPACGGGDVPPDARLLAPSPPPASTPPPPSTVPPPVETTPAPAARGVEMGPPTLLARPFALPGATSPASLDYIAFEPKHGRLWVPVGSAGSIDVLDTASGTFTKVEGFATATNGKRTRGPNAAFPGDGVVYVGDRANGEICPIDAAKLEKKKCVKAASPTDGVAWIASAKEVWATMPSVQSLVVFDATAPDVLKPKTTIKLTGAPEGYAIDAQHGLFFTNLEDKGATLVLDVKTHAQKAKWDPQCGTDGPRGLAFDAAHDFLVVACTDHVQVLDAGHDGAPLGRLDTGGGLDNLDFADGKVFAAAGKAAKLFVAALDDKGQLTVVATADTAEGARNAVADGRGNVYVADSQNARILAYSMKP